MQSGEVDIAVPTCIEFTLKVVSGIELKESGAVAAKGDVLVDGLRGYCCIWDGGGRVVPFAKVEDVRRVEFVDTQVFGKGVEVIVDLILNIRCQVVEEAYYRVAAGGLSRVDDVLADARCIELCMSVVVPVDLTMASLTVTTA